MNLRNLWIKLKMGASRDGFDCALCTFLPPGAQKSAAVFAVRRANYTHRRKGVFNGQKYSGSDPARQCFQPQRDS